ncbi:hypothetical protein LTR96_007141 [Exophiala xenobiotica]|nr:hypothetical protein LTR92_007688 [Exophiala xenobiotica]KAK5532203.1 hypothetical protein LTR23_009645 [Chaetothyriales sp. CCFEE 6169]KAK5205372.1 hypothetical protein LTR41_008826 [Exophiala xenobiotica]KAK5249438.1 hypothetical protein LTS06_005664 [Exophiala xenobiotica]KAK5267813.1 hypothetical protein LTR96_007141 [Exophiala xenobiotica]
MRKPSIPDLVYQRTFPKPKQGDPGSFYAHIHRYIVSEIRIEVQTYFGTIDTLEAQYPGLDYTYPPHRHRLSRHAWHRRLFRVFDELGLTNDEILSLCQWEGTRAAKERYECEAQTEVKTTIGADIPAAPRGNGPRALWEDWTSHRLEQRSSDSDAGVEVEEKEVFGQQSSDGESDFEGEETEESEEEDKQDAEPPRGEGQPSGRNSALVNQAREQRLLDAYESNGQISWQTLRNMGSEAVPDGHAS